MQTPITRIRRVSTLLLLLALSRPALPAVANEKGVRRAARVAKICENYLTDARYEKSNLLLGEEGEAVLALKPESGSIADRDPSVVSELIQIHNQLYDRRNRVTLAGENPEEVKALWNEFIGRLATIQFDHNDPRLQRLLRETIESMKLSSAREPGKQLSGMVTQVNAKLWELTVACFFNGEDILIGQRVRDVYPNHYKQAKAQAGEAGLSPEQRKIWDRELDIVVHQADGRDRWIEVKDWQPGTTLLDNSKKHVRLQSEGQNLARRAIGCPIDLVLVMKYGVPGLDYLQYRVESNYDDMLFVFPEGMPQY